MADSLDKGRDSARQAASPKLIGDPSAARLFDQAAPIIEWSCCAGVVCGIGARRTVTSRRIAADNIPEGLAVYRLSSKRHPHMIGCEVAISEDGSMLRLYSGDVLTDWMPRKREASDDGGAL